MELDYTLILSDISKTQGLGLEVEELPLFVTTETSVFQFAHILYEDEKYITIFVEDQNGAEFGKVLNKEKIESIEIIYAQMLEEPKEPKGDVTYE